MRRQGVCLVRPPYHSQSRIKNGLIIHSFSFKTRMRWQGVCNAQTPHHYQATLTFFTRYRLKRECSGKAFVTPEHPHHYQATFTFFTRSRLKRECSGKAFVTPEHPTTTRQRSHFSLVLVYNENAAARRL